MIHLETGTGMRLAMQLSAREEGFAVRVLKSPDGHQTPDQALRLQRLEDVLRMVSQPTFHEDVGRGLFRALFPGELNDIYRAAFTQATVTGRSLTLALHFEPDAMQAASYPWELLHDGTRFLLQAGGINLVRYAPFAAPLPEHPARRPLDVLTVSAAPRDPLAPRRSENTMPGSDGPMAAGVRTLHRVAEPLVTAEQVDVATLLPPTWDALHEWALAGAPDVLHLTMPGGFARTGQVVFEDERGQLDPVGADVVGDLFFGSRIQAVVWCGTETMQAATEPLLGSVPFALVAAGIPAVVGLPYALPDDVLGRFLGTLYEQIFAGAALDEAFAQARKALVRTTYWHVPSLCLRAVLPVARLPQADAASDLAADFARRIDTVAPRAVPAHTVFRMALWLASPDAPPPDRQSLRRLLGYSVDDVDPRDPTAAPVESIPVPVAAGDGHFEAGQVSVRVTAAGCAIHGHHTWTLPAVPERALSPLWFALTPRTAGMVSVIIELLQGEKLVARVTHDVRVLPEAVGEPRALVRSHYGSGMAPPRRVQPETELEPRQAGPATTVQEVAAGTDAELASDAFVGETAEAHASTPEEDELDELLAATALDEHEWDVLDLLEDAGLLQMDDELGVEDAMMGSEQPSRTDKEQAAPVDVQNDLARQVIEQYAVNVEKVDVPVRHATLRTIEVPVLLTTQPRKRVLLWGAVILLTVLLIVAAVVLTLVR